MTTGFHSNVRRLASLTDKKAKLRPRLEGCKSAQHECAFELAFSVLPPRSLKPVSCTAMTGLVANAIATVDACESKFALIGEQETDETYVQTPAGSPLSEEPEAGSARLANDNSGDATDSPFKSSGSLADKVKLVKPRREIESGDAELLESILTQVRGPIADFQGRLDRAVDAIVTCLAYCCDLPKLPSGSITPKGIRLE